MEDEMEDVYDKQNDFLWYDPKQKRYMIEIRNVESWNGTMYLETYDAPLDDTDSYWRLRINLMVQSGNDRDIWWDKRKDLYFKAIPGKELNKKANGIFQKLINGYAKNLKLNVPIGIRKYISSYLMVEMGIYKDFYFIYKDYITKQIANSKEEIPHSLSARNIKWKSPWKGPTGDKYKTPEQLFYYNYEEDRDDKMVSSVGCKFRFKR